MRRIALCLSLAVSLSACDAMEHNAERLGDSIGYGYDKTRYKISDYIYDREQAAPNPQQADQMPNQAYCYKLQADTVCYNEPVARMSPTLVGSQSGNSYVAESYAAMPSAPDTPTYSAAAPEPVAITEAPEVAASTDDASDAPTQLMSGF